MPLSPGTRIGQFEILSFLGAGGMGEVYRARDLTLGRDVALKFVAGAVAVAPERRARFEREARCLAALSHPGIAAIYGLLEDAGRPVIAMELVEGETLDKRLRRGALPLRLALDVCRRIAEALAAAHEKGIVHRDLKPSNVTLLPDGRVKLLDFGLAKVLEAEGASSSERTVSIPADDASHAGLVVGTAPYMSPEQARGEELDRRTDIWSLGCVLYETLTGRRAFAGATRSDTIAAVLDREPNWSALAAETPPKVRDLLRRCLCKERGDRLRDAWDVRIELVEALAEFASGPSAAAAAASPRRRRTSRLRRTGVAVGCLACAALGWLAARTLGRPAPPASADAPARWTIALPPGVSVPRLNGPPGLALSPDGKTLVFVGDATVGAGRTQLYVRELGSIDARPIPMTEGAGQVCFSPDGKWIAFDQEGELKKLRLDGGTPTLLAEAPTLRGASWGADGAIVFSPDVWSGLWRVSDHGGAPRRLTTPDAKFYGSHRWAQVLPTGDVLFTINSGFTHADSAIAVYSPKTGRARVVLKGGGFARYVSSGHLIFAREGGLLAAPFDLERLEVTGPSAAVLEDVRMDPFGFVSAQFDVSPSGALAYVPGYPRVLDRSLLWVDRAGHATPVTPERRGYCEATLSPDGGAVAVLREEASALSAWSLDLRSQTWTLLVRGVETRGLVWSPDGTRVAHEGPDGLAMVRRDGSGGAEQITREDVLEMPTSWSADGRFVAFVAQYPETDADIWIAPLAGDRRPWAYLATSAQESGGAFSPDGRWLAYASTESGRSEVYVRSFPRPGPKRQVSFDGGMQPKWTRGGREIVYRSLGPAPKMMAVPVELGAVLRAGTPRPLFADAYRNWVAEMPGYDVSRDGERFLMIEEPPSAAPPTQIVVIPRFLDELKAKLRGAR